MSAGVKVLPLSPRPLSRRFKLWISAIILSLATGAGVVAVIGQQNPQSIGERLFQFQEQNWGQRPCVIIDGGGIVHAADTSFDAPSMISHKNWSFEQIGLCVYHKSLYDAEERYPFEDREIRRIARVNWQGYQAQRYLKVYRKQQKGYDELRLVEDLRQVGDTFLQEERPEVTAYLRQRSAAATAKTMAEVKRNNYMGKY